MVGQGSEGCGAMGVVRRTKCGGERQAIIHNLPEDIQWYIWRMYFKQYVVAEFYGKYQFVWENPSDYLKKICKDKGCVQHGHSELEDLIDDENMWCWDVCVGEKCENCKYHGFPCNNLAYYGFMIPGLAGQWDANF